MPVSVLCETNMFSSDKPQYAPSSWIFPATTTSIAADIALLLARLYGGITIARAGLDKLPTPDWMTDQVTQVGWFPAPSLFAVIACITEFVAGILLAAGLFTRISGGLLAFTMGVAAFGFHQVYPLTDMHITQGFFWLFVLFSVLGPGRISVDQLSRWLLESKRCKAAWLIAGGLSLAMLTLGLYKQFEPLPQKPAAQEPTISGISIAGSFNDWDLAAQPMTSTNQSAWDVVLQLEEAGPIEFKFAANQSWDINFGEVDDQTAGMPVDGTAERGGDNIRAYIPSPGLYRVTVDLESYQYRVEAISQPQ